MIDVQSDATASGHSYLIFLAAPLTEEPLPLTAGPIHVGEFKDRFIHTEQGWKFQERRGSLALKTA